MRRFNKLNLRISTFAYTRLASVTAICVGALALFGWWLDIAIFKSIVPGLPTMKANTAIGFLLSGLSLWLKHATAPQSRLPRGIGNA